MRRQGGVSGSRQGMTALSAKRMGRLQSPVIFIAVAGRIITMAKTTRACECSLCQTDAAARPAGGGGLLFVRAANSHGSRKNKKFKLLRRTVNSAHRQFRGPFPPREKDTPPGMEAVDRVGNKRSRMRASFTAVWPPPRPPPPRAREKEKDTMR